MDTTHYIDMCVRPDEDFPASQLMGALVIRLHRALVAHGAGDIGVSFPDHNAQRLGNRLRLHGSQQALAALMAQDWLKGMRDHLDLSPASPVPTHARHRQVKRVQTQSSPERLRRRLMKRHNLTEAQAAERIPDTAAQLAALPSVWVRSSSTGQAFRLFIQHGPLSEEPISGATGAFNAYGLSQGASVPWF
ncbi:MAG: type I-F CRISPR-associated endoribonuclease Cas6/Csy4 [Hydrogenophaga sp.]|nr:type I-F CRISPR-associated endoribonuclease Cas6/Csy4 [Hydrogenophaga sp.]MDP1894129.1 type I-F CRISPR-associated endoribonuclease Cas6/Csy4 [Hydrogenophaga sp.]